MKNLVYKFVEVTECNMCGASVKDARVLGRRMNRSQGIRPKGKVGIATTVVKCRRCGLIFSNPLPIPETIEQHYEKPPESYWTENYFKIDDTYFDSQIDTFLSLYKSSENLTALDVGAGIGKCMTALARRGFTAYGLEPSKPFYERAVTKMNISQKKLKLSALENSDYSNEMFDFITFGAVLEHLYNPSESIIKTMRWLKRGGLIHIEVPSSDWLTNKIFNFVYKLQGLDYVANISPMHDPFHLYEFGLNSFRLHAAANNYEIARYEYAVCDSYLPGILDFLVKPVMEKTDTGMQLEIWLRKSDESV